MVPIPPSPLPRHPRATALGVVGAAVALLAGSATAGGAAASGVAGVSGVDASRPDCRSDPKRVQMTPTPRARGVRGTMVVRMGSSPYGVAVDADGSYRLRVEVVVDGLGSRHGAHHVAWAATPELDRHVRLGTLGPDGRAAGEVTWNKFLVFVTAETTPEPERWSQEILLSALSPSGRMHTMAGHGPFSGEPCLDPRS